MTPSTGYRKIALPPCRTWGRKITGTLRTEQGADSFCPLMSTVLTWRTKGHDVHEELVTTLQ